MEEAKPRPLLQAAPGEQVVQFSVPQKLLQLTGGSQNDGSSSITTSTSNPLLSGGGTFICDYRNGAADVREFFAQLGWAQAAGPAPSQMCSTRNGCNPVNRHWNCSCVLTIVSNMPTFTFYWGSLSSTSFALCYAASMQTYRPLVMNRIPWVTLISNKNQLATTCMAHRQRQGAITLQNHVPATLVLDRTTDRANLPAIARRLLAMHPVWIVKPHNYAKGEGIKIAFREDGEEAMVQNLIGDKWGITKVVQCYMTDPMLLAKKKFDLRVFLLLVSTGRGLQAFYHCGYVRLALNDFAMKEKQRLDTHLTNQAVQAKQSGYEANKEDTTWTVNQMNSYLNNEPGGAFGSDWTLNELHPMVKKLVIALVEALVQRVQRERLNQPGQRDRYPCRNTFSLLGLDVLIDSSGKPWLIEANADPALSRQTRTLEQLLPAVTAEAFGLAAEIIFRGHAAGGAEQPEKLQFLQNFQALGHFAIAT